MRSWLLWTVGVIAGAAVVSATACGGDDTTATGGSGGSAGGPTTQGGGGSTTTNPSTGGSGGTSQGGSGGTGGGGGVFVPMCQDAPNDTVLAIDALKFGSNDTQAWKTIGFNLDGVVSMNDCSAQCDISAMGSAGKECTDGMNGIDNSFGQVIVPFLKTNTVNIDDQANGALQMGEFTVMLDFVNLTADANQGSVKMNMYNGGALGEMPKFDGTDCWPVTPESLKVKTDITKPKASFAMTAITDNHVTTGVLDVLPLSFATDIGPISLNVHAARLEFDLSASHDAAINGFVGGVIDRAEFNATIQAAIYTRFGPTLGKTLCHQGDSTIAGAVDIKDDGTAGVGTSCNGISFGVAFTAKLVKFGGIGPSTPATHNDCPAMP